MASLNDYISSLSQKKPNYGSLFANIPSSPAPLNSLFATSQSTPATKAPTTPPLVSSAPASTKPAPAPTPAPAKVTPTTSPQSQYVNTLASNNASSNATPAYLQPGYKSPGQIADEKAAGGSTSSPGSSSGSGSSYLDAYRDYLSQYAASLKPSDEVTAARQKVADIDSKISERTLKARREYEAALNKEGGTQAGNNASAAALSRLNDSQLADLAVQETAATNSLSALTGDSKTKSDTLKNLLDLSKPITVGDQTIDPTTGKVISDKSKDAFSLSEGQSRYEYDPKTGTYNKVASAPKTTAAGTTGTPIIGSNGSTYTPGVNTTVDSWANRIQSGQAKITDIPAKETGLRNAVTIALDAMGNSADGKPTTTEMGKAALQTAKDLMSKFEKGEGTSVVGGSRLFGGALAGVTPGTNAANFKNDFNSLKSQLSLEGVKYLKGQGQVSDAERALLSQAVTKLNLAQSDTEFKTTLQSIIDKLSGGNVSPAGVLRSPDGTQEVSVSDLTPKELEEAKAAGWK